MIEERFGIQILPTWHEGPDGDKAGFIWAIRVALNKILLSHAGRVLADSLRFQMKTILVMPYEGNDGNAEEDGVTPGSQQSAVLFTPTTGASCCSGGKAATRPHEILVHEPVHALRRASGHLHQHRVINKL